MMVNEASSSSGKRKENIYDSGFTQLLLSWSVADILNEDLYKDQVMDIPDSFQSIAEYFGSFIYALLEEIRTKLCSCMNEISKAPFAEVTSVSVSGPEDQFMYDVKVSQWRTNGQGNEPHYTLPGDLVFFSNRKPEHVSDLGREGWTWTIASVIRATEGDDFQDNDSSNKFKVIASNEIDFKEGQHSLSMVFLTNVLTERRIWNSLHKACNAKIVQEAIRNSSAEAVEDCTVCLPLQNSHLAAVYDDIHSSGLNKSQSDAIVSSIFRTYCWHKPSIELIWGPPGTGKTKTISVMLFSFLKMKYRTLVCTPTNIAIKEIASRTLRLLKDSCEDASLLSLGGLLLLGNNDRLKVDGSLEEIYLDFRVQRLIECFGPMTGWRHCLNSTSDFLTDCVPQYEVYIDNELKQAEKESNREKPLSFLEFVREKFGHAASSLRICIRTLFSHLPQHFINEHNKLDARRLLHLIDLLEGHLFDDNVSPKELKKTFLLFKETSYDSDETLSTLSQTIRKTLSALTDIRHFLHRLELPNAMNGKAVEEFCLKWAYLIFSTASTSYKLHSMPLEPFKVLVIDEASQLKECESTIPLQIPGLMHAILVGDELQLPAMVSSKVSESAGFGRSLFERLSLLGHPKHLLNEQYRMHPSISLFPNSKFYSGKILDAPNVMKDYERNLLTAPMFGPYTFINIRNGVEEREEDGNSLRNLVEVAIVIKILRNLHKAWSISKQRLSIGIISPYAAQVAAIRDKLPTIYEDLDGFLVKVMSIDGFQGGEEDIIMISTVRSNAGGYVGFMSSRQRTNVALTRARHCLWILGSEKTMENSETIWASIVRDAKKRQCFFNADEEKDLERTIVEVKKKLDQWNDLLNEDSIYFKDAQWKVLFSDNFKTSFFKLNSTRKKMSVMNLLLSLSCGWRPKSKNVDLVCQNSSHILKQFKVEGLFLICTIDIKKEERYIQVLKIWDVLPSDEVTKLLKRLEGFFAMYTDDYISRCKEKILQGNLELPKSWPTTFNIVQYKTLGNQECGNLNSDSTISNNYVENSKVSESLILMKFYSLSSGVMNHLLSNQEGKELELPFEVTDQERELILFPKSTFILGRSGTGKTTVLTMKLFEKEQQHQIALTGFSALDTNATSRVIERNEFGEASRPQKENNLRQLFVTVSPKLCYAIKQHVSGLKRFSCGESFSMDEKSEDPDDSAWFTDISDSFIDIPHQTYPLVITFNKFLMMLDGTSGNSFFDRFVGANELYGTTLNSRSIALQTFIRSKEVTYDRFYSVYWPHFNSNLIKKFDASRVFTEIISCIKGGLQAGKTYSGKLDLDEYKALSDGRLSTLTKQKRQEIYEIFQDYEKMKMENGDFDLADLVIDLHHRLRKERFQGDEIDFVYIDEVQDLSMQQIALFKYVCNNVEEGFVFSGDTAQTIARGIDFRFEDIRCLFYNEFMMESGGGDAVSGRRDMKGQMSDIFNLNQNFRTHDGVLRLAQSVIDLIYNFFPQSIDFLNPERSLIYGESPVLLESGSDENAIVTIFGSSGSMNSNIVGFGAEQVILVRDDDARVEITGYVGKHALVLTITECKGLEFQDVLLYNFFGSSPLKNQWRVIYEFMKLKELHDDKCKSFPNFDITRHGILCSELKQLYVAITRTRQRLWICENKEELSKPMFDYWKKLCLVQVRQLDDSLAKAMQVASCPEEWKQRGIKLFYESNYEMATMCFERAGDLTWERRAKATGLKAAADRLRGSNDELAFTILREAAKIFESIGKVELSAECLFELGEFEKAGRIYLDKPELRKAGECFFLSGRFDLAADVYARGGFLAECLSVCTEGKLYDVGLKYIEYWKQHDLTDGRLINNCNRIDEMEQKFLQSCAMSYYELEDRVTMMKFVRAFQSIDAKRKFLNSLDCLDELLLVEEESGNFLEAAEIAKMRGDLLLEADLLGKGGCSTEAARLLIWSVFLSSLWADGSTGWPLKSFATKEELLGKAISFAKAEPKLFKLISTHAMILSGEKAKLSDWISYLHASMKIGSLQDEFFSIWRILDLHLSVHASKYEVEDEIIDDPFSHSQKIVLRDSVSVASLLFYWNLWTKMIDKIIGFLVSTKKPVLDEHNVYALFCFEYFGVRKQFNKLNAGTYHLLIPEAFWVKGIDKRFLRKKGNQFHTDFCDFSTAALGYWRSEMLCTGLKVLGTLEAISRRTSPSLFKSTMPFLHIYMVAKYLDTNHLEGKYHDMQKLQYFLRKSYQHFHYVFPMDLNHMLADNIVSMRRTNNFRSLLHESLLEGVVSSKGGMTHGQIGRMMVLHLSSGRPSDELFIKIAEGLSCKSLWKIFFEDSNLGIVSRISAYKLMTALKDTYQANWMVRDYISPTCFLYMLERLLLLTSLSQKFLFTTKSVLVEWLIYEKPCTNLTNNPEKDTPHEIFNFVEFIIKELLFAPTTEHWILNSGVSIANFYPKMVLRCVIMSCLLYLNADKGMHYEMLNTILRQRRFTSKLPANFVTALRTRNTWLNADVVSDALATIGDPLVIVSWEVVRYPENVSPSVILLELGGGMNRENILSLLFPRKTNPLESVVEHGISTLFQEISYALRLVEETTDKNSDKFMSHLQNIKIELEKVVMSISSSRKQTSMGEDEGLLLEVKDIYEDLVQHVLKTREMGELVPMILELLRKLNMQKPILEMFFSKQPMQEGVESIFKEDEAVSKEEKITCSDEDQDANEIAKVTSYENEEQGEQEEVEEEEEEEGQRQNKELNATKGKGKKKKIKNKKKKGKGPKK